MLFITAGEFATMAIAQAHVETMVVVEGNEVVTEDPSALRQCMEAGPDGYNHLMNQHG